MPILQRKITQEGWLIMLRRGMLALTFAMMSLWFATNSSFAACTNNPDAIQRAADFLGNPSSLLNGPNGSRGAADITNDVRDFVSANPQALAAIIALLKGSGLSSDQQKAIGSGLGLAAGVCLRPDPTFAAEIQTQLAGTDSADAKTQYAAITGNNPIRSVAAGGAGGGVGSTGSSGGPTTPSSPTTGSSSSQAFTSNSVTNSPTNFFGGSAGGAGSSTSTTTSTTTNIVCSVSTTCQ